MAIKINFVFIFEGTFKVIYADLAWFSKYFDQKHAVDSPPSWNKIYINCLIFYSPNF